MSDLLELKEKAKREQWEAIYKQGGACNGEYPTCAAEVDVFVEIVREFQPIHQQEMEIKLAHLLDSQWRYHRIRDAAVNSGRVRMDKWGSLILAEGA